MAKGVIQKHEAMCEAIKKLIESKDSLDKVLNDANFAQGKCKFEMPEEASGAFEKGKSNHGWLEWDSLKKDASIANVYQALLDQFKKDMDTWMKWHQQCASNKYNWTDALKYGTEFETKLSITLNDVQTDANTMQ